MRFQSRRFLRPFLQQERRPFFMTSGAVCIFETGIRSCDWPNALNYNKRFFRSDSKNKKSIKQTDLSYDL
ncbi:hypothetical protein HK11_04610 [Acetobacter sp. DmW_043]|nr:hypothetical protein HK11_04610 [Acetobacter sp. DmW_043]